MRGLENARMIFIPESNLGFSASYQHLLLRQFPGLDIVTMFEDDFRAGVRTDHRLKQAMMVAFNEKLTKRKVIFHQEFFSIGSNTEELAAKIMEQSRHYAIIRIPSKNIYNEPTIKICGKHGFGKDDLIVALQLNFVMHKRFFQSAAYSQYRNV